MIAVDSSVWVAALRSAESRQADVLGSLLDADEVALPVPVRVELLSGASRADRGPLGRALSALPILYPSDDTWRLVGEWVDQAAGRGHHFGFGDLLIGALTAEAGALVWSLDSDFERMSDLGLIDLYADAS